MSTINAEKNQLAKEADDLLESQLAAEAEWGKAESLLAEARLESKAWVSRADALSEALDQARKSSGLEEISELEGVIGTLLELIEIDEGWEAALEAAIGSSFASVVVQDFDIARRALEALRFRTAFRRCDCCWGSGGVWHSRDIKSPCALLNTISRVFA